MSSKEQLPPPVDLSGDEDPEDEQMGVLNPFPIAEAVLGMRVPWKHIDSPHLLLQAVFGMPYTSLFNPDRATLLHSRNVAEAEGVVETRFQTMDDEQGDPALSFAEGASPPRFPEHTYRGRSLTYTFDRGALMQVLREILPGGAGTSEDDDDDVASASTSASSALYAWRDVGDFFARGWTSPAEAEGADPIQGNVGDCYFIAALSAVAWATPQIISWPRPPGARTEVDDIIFYLPPEGGGRRRAHTVPVDETLPVWAGSGLLLYASSREWGEIWPGIYEKAYAALVTGDTTGRPDISAIAFGQPARALRMLTGLSTTTSRLWEMTDDEVLTAIQDECDGGRRVRSPMVTWTWPTAGTATSATGERVSYTDYNLVASHAYTLLGWEMVGSTPAAILRNPYGARDLGSTGVSSVRTALDTDAWRDVRDLDQGVFPLPLALFRTHFRKMSVAR